MSGLLSSDEHIIVLFCEGIITNVQWRMLSIPIMVCWNVSWTSSTDRQTEVLLVSLSKTKTQKVNQSFCASLSHTQKVKPCKTCLIELGVLLLKVKNYFALFLVCSTTVFWIRLILLKLLINYYEALVSCFLCVWTIRHFSFQ